MIWLFEIQLPTLVLLPPTSCLNPLLTTSTSETLNPNQSPRPPFPLPLLPPSPHCPKSINFPLKIMSPEEANLSNAIQKLLDDAVARGVAPGLVAAVSNSRETFASACSGVVGVAEGKKDQKFNLDTIVWPASAAKFMVSLIVLIIVEREKFDLDSHEELVKVIPELGKDWPGTRIWKIIDGEDENGEYKYRDAKVGM